MKSMLCINERPRQRGPSLALSQGGQRDDVWLNSVPPSREEGRAQAGPSAQPGFRFATGPAPSWQLWKGTWQYQNGEMFILQWACVPQMQSVASWHEEPKYFFLLSTAVRFKSLLGPNWIFWIISSP